jgi:hypothetical protein
LRVYFLTNPKRHIRGLSAALSAPTDRGLAHSGMHREYRRKRDVDLLRCLLCTALWIRGRSGWVGVARCRVRCPNWSDCGGRAAWSTPRLLFIVGCVGSGSLIGLSLILSLPAVAAITLMGAGWLTHGVVMVSTVVLLVDRSPAGRAVTLTLNSSAQSFGWAVGAGTGGIVLAAAGYVALGLWTLVLALVSALLIFIRRPSRSPV